MMTFSRGHLEQEADRDESFVPDFPPFFAAVSEMFFASWQKISGADGLQVKRLHLSPIMFFFNSISFRPGHFWKTKHPLNILSSELTMNSKLKTKVWKIRAEVLLWNHQPWLSDRTRANSSNVSQLRILSNRYFSIQPKFSSSDSRDFLSFVFLLLLLVFALFILRMSRS